MNPEEMIAVLLATADEQQKTVEGLLALAKRQEGELEKAGPALRAAVVEAVRLELRGVASTASDATAYAMKPSMERLDEASRAAKRAAADAAAVTFKLGARWPLIAGASCAAMFLVTLAGMWGITAWQRGQIDDLREQRAALAGELVVMRAQADELAAKGGRIKLSHCGGKKRLCAQVDTSASFGDRGDYYVLKGY